MRGSKKVGHTSYTHHFLTMIRTFLDTLLLNFNILY